MSSLRVLFQNDENQSHLFKFYLGSIAVYKPIHLNVNDRILSVEDDVRLRLQQGKAMLF